MKGDCPKRRLAGDAPSSGVCCGLTLAAAAAQGSGTESCVVGSRGVRAVMSEGELAL